MMFSFRQLDKPLSHNALICRGCLAESGEMKNIFDWGWSGDFTVFTNIELTKSDVLSELLCSKCEEMLKTCINFRKQCQNSDGKLRNMLEDMTENIELEKVVDYFFLQHNHLTCALEPPNAKYKIWLPCSYECKNVFPDDTRLLAHLVKVHDIDEDDFDIEIQYSCPRKGCDYNSHTGYSLFTERKWLNHHYYEAHKIQDFQCSECMASFVKRKDYMRHLVVCPISFGQKSIEETLPEEATSDETVVESKKQENTVECSDLGGRLVFTICAPDTESKIYLPCPYDCSNTYIKKRDLFTHIIKQHKMNEKTFSIQLQYHCSVNDCPYHLVTGDCFFTERKFLNQHYIKRHKSKDFLCPDCMTSYATAHEFSRHVKNCNVPFVCEICSSEYKTHERWLVHLMRKHPDEHKKYKQDRKNNKRKSQTLAESKKSKLDDKFNELMCDSPKRSFATQTNRFEQIKNDVTLPSWSTAKKDENSTQTVFEDMLSLKSQTSEDDSIFFPESVLLTDIQTQTFPIEFGLSRSNKETITSETQSPELNIKETQTCVCLYESPKPNFRIFDSISSSPASINLTSTETQTANIFDVKNENIFSLNSIETQTCFDEDLVGNSM